MTERLQRLIGARVERVRLGDDQELVLHFSNAKVVRIPAPWAFTSCLMSILSAQFEGEPEGMVGLEGAQLTGVESEGELLDLVFNSIRISVSG